MTQTPMQGEAGSLDGEAESVVMVRVFGSRRDNHHNVLRPTESIHNLAAGPKPPLGQAVDGPVWIEIRSNLEDPANSRGREKG